MSRYSWLVAVTLLGAAACGGDTAPGASAGDAGVPAAGGDDAADIAAYELTMEKMDRMYAAQRNIAVAIRDMTPAERATMEATDMSEGSLEEFARGIENNPKIRQALGDAGIEPREYATATMAMVAAAMAASVLQSRPNDDPDSLARELNANRDNIRFLRDNEAELTRKQQALEAELRAMGALNGTE